MIQIDTENTVDTAAVTVTLETAEREITFRAEQAIQSFLLIGRALKIIRDGDLFREGGFESFAAYLDARAFKGWTIGQTQGYKYIKVFERYGNRLVTLGCTNLDVLYLLKDTPDDEIEKLAESGQLSEMTVRDAKDYKKELEAAQEQISLLSDAVKVSQDDLKSERELYDTLSDDFDRLRKENEELAKKNKELSERPIEVTSVSDEEINRIKSDARKEAEKQLRKEFESEKKKAVKEAVSKEKERSEAAVVAAENDKSDLEEENTELRKTLENLTAEKESSDSRIQELERSLQSTEKSAQSDESMIEFRFYFNEVKNYLEKFLDVIGKVKDPERRKKFRGAARKFIQAILNDLDDPEEPEDDE